MRSRRPGVARRRPAGVRVGMLVAGALVVTACSGSDRPDLLPVSTPPPATTVLEDPSTTASTSTTTTSTTASSTAAPTTTEPIDDEAAVKQAYLEFRRAFTAALADPTSSVGREAFVDEATGQLLLSGLEGIDLYAERGWTGVPHPTVDPSVTFYEVEVAGDSAVALVCRVNSAAVVQLATGESEDVVVDDSVAVQIEEITFEFAEGRWLPSTGLTIENRPGELMCEE